MSGIAARLIPAGGAQLNRINWSRPRLQSGKRLAASRPHPLKSCIVGCVGKNRLLISDQRFMSKWKIRECVQEEVPAILNLWREAGATVSATDTASALLQAVAESPACVLVAEVDGELIGSVIGTFDGWRGNIYRLVVHPSHQRQGIARALVVEVEKRLAHQGVERITALVERDHTWATGFWDAVEYERDTRMVRYVRNLPTSL